MQRISNDIRLEVDPQNNLIIFTGKKEKNYFDYNEDLFQILRTQCGVHTHSCAGRKTVGQK